MNQRGAFAFGALGFTLIDHHIHKAVRTPFLHHGNVFRAPSAAVVVVVVVFVVVVVVILA